MTSEVRVTKKQRKWRRSYKACLNCRSRKVRCDLGSFDAPHAPPCIRCKREQKECLFTSRSGHSSTTTLSTEVSPAQTDALSRVGNTPVSSTPSTASVVSNTGYQGADSAKTHNPSSARNSVDQRNSESEKGSSLNDKWRLGVTSMQNTLEFLASAAGTVAEKEANPAGAIPRASPTAVPSGQGSSACGDASQTNMPLPLPPLDSSDPQRESVVLLEKVRSVRPKPRNLLRDIDYIGPSGLLTEAEAVELIDAFFLTMYPFFPYIPLQLQEADELAAYPILLCAVLTVSSRYHPFGELGLHGGPDGRRHVAVHETLWSHCQWMISQTIWAEAGTRSIGTVLAFIILTDWNPRQIHFKNSDYSSGFYKRGEGRGEAHGIPTGIGAIRRSDRMAWMLTGTAVRLAQDMEFIQSSTRIFVATHIADTFASINMNQRPVLADTFSAVSLGMNQAPAAAPAAAAAAAEPGSRGLGNEKFYLDEILRGDGSAEFWKARLDPRGAGSVEQQQQQQQQQRPPLVLSAVEREFLNDEYVLYYANRGDERYEPPVALPHALEFPPAQRAKIELVRITLVAYDTIYHERGRRRLATGDAAHNLAVLDLLSPLLDGWHGSYGALLAPVAPEHYDVGLRGNRGAAYRLVLAVNRESILSDYYYCQLYIYSLALQTEGREGREGRESGPPRLQINEIIKSAKYVELAFGAARAILASAARVHRLGMLKFMPVRWVVRIVRSVSFIVKCYLTLTGGGGGGGDAAGNRRGGDAQSILRLCCISPEDTIATIRGAAVILREATPDELHLGVRYSEILLYLCAELQQRRTPGSEAAPESEAAPASEASGGGEARGGSAGNEASAGNAGNAGETKTSGVSARGDGADVFLDRGMRTMLFGAGASPSPAECSPPAESAPAPPASRGMPIPAVAGMPTGVGGNSDVGATPGADAFPTFSDQVIDWFAVRDDIGLDFVEPWTQMIEQQYLQSGGGGTGSAPDTAGDAS